jgi:hypothetical protein
MVTPLTTLLAEGMTGEEIAKSLGLPLDTNITTLDPAFKVGGVLQNADLFRKTLVVQQVLQKTAEALAELGSSTDVSGMYSQAAAAMATTLKGGAILVAENATSTDTVKAVVQAAATRVSAGVDAGNLARVVSGALAIQANQILLAQNSQAISDATKAQQGSTAITTFVKANRNGMQAGSSVTTLAQELSGKVSEGGGVTPPPTPPALAGTALISWDEATSPVTGIGAFGDGGPDVAAGPAGGNGMALKLSRSGASNFGGTFFTVPAIPFTADRKTVTARVFATRANSKVFLKVEAGAGVATEVAATVSAANTWQTLTWNLNGVNPANSYKTMVFSADTDVANLGAQTYWVDDITLSPAAEVVTPPVTPPASVGTHGLIHTGKW